MWGRTHPPRTLWDRFQAARNQNLPGIPRDELLGYMQQTADRLDLLNLRHHRQHLDLKPQNLLLIHSRVEIADSGVGGMSPFYAAPETFDGVVSRFCDQYSLAVVYPEMLTGLRPFSGNSVQRVIVQHLSAVPNLSPLPAGDRPIIARGLDKSPENRHPCCSEMIEALRNVDPKSGARE
jgi:serine/threonine protein kinase